MKSYLFFLTILILFITVSCRRASEETAPEPEVTKEIFYQDSVSFTISGKKYVHDHCYSRGISNMQVNLKPYKEKLEDRILAYGSEGNYWYGAKDSTLYETRRTFGGTDEPGNICISFSKKYHNSQLRQASVYLIPRDTRPIFTTGKKTFAIDLDKMNTTDGIGIIAHIQNNEDKLEEMTTFFPNRSLLAKTTLDKDLQNNSTFEIVKFEKLNYGWYLESGNMYLIEARFEVNLYNKKEEIYRLENGFIRFVTSLNNQYYY